MIPARGTTFLLVAIVAGAVVSAMLLGVACGPPPDGWPGAGRSFTLPTASGGSEDAGEADSSPTPPADTGTLPPADTGTAPPPADASKD